MRNKGLFYLSILSIPFLCMSGERIKIFLNTIKEVITFSYSPGSMSSKSISIVDEHDDSQVETYTAKDYKGKFTYQPVKAYGPFTGDQDTFNFSVVFQYNGTKALHRCQFQLIYYNIAKNGTETVTKYSKPNLTNEHQKSFQYTYPISGLSKSKSIRIKYGLFSNELDDFADYVMFTFNIQGNYSVDPFFISGATYYNDKTRFYANGKFILEELEFPGFKKILTTDRYNRILINEYYLTYYSPEYFTYESAFLLYEDKKDIFKHVKVNDEGYKQIPLKLTEQGNRVYLDFEGNFGIDPNSLEMYIPNSGKTMTNYFYVPKNTGSLLNGETFKIRINGAGFSHFFIECSVQFYVDTFIIGDCVEGDYCVIGGVRE